MRNLLMRIEAAWIILRCKLDPKVRNIELSEEDSERIYQNIMDRIKEEEEKNKIS